MTQTYISPEAKRRQEYKYYNNTNIYISFREDFLPNINLKGGARELFEHVIQDELAKDEHAEPLASVDLN